MDGIRPAEGIKVMVAAQKEAFSCGWFWESREDQLMRDRENAVDLEKRN